MREYKFKQIRRLKERNSNNNEGYINKENKEKENIIRIEVRNKEYRVIKKEELNIIKKELVFNTEFKIQYLLKDLLSSFNHRFSSISSKGILIRQGGGKGKNIEEVYKSRPNELLFLVEGILYLSNIENIKERIKKINNKYNYLSFSILEI